MKPPIEIQLVFPLTVIPINGTESWSAKPKATAALTRFLIIASLRLDINSITPSPIRA